MAADARFGETRAVSQREQFPRAEARRDGTHTIVHRNRVPAEDRPGDREETVGDGMALQIIDDQQPA